MRSRVGTPRVMISDPNPLRLARYSLGAAGFLNFRCQKTKNTGTSPQLRLQTCFFLRRDWTSRKSGREVWTNNIKPARAGSRNLSAPRVPHDIPRHHQPRARHSTVPRRYRLVLPWQPRLNLLPAPLTLLAPYVPSALVQNGSVLSFPSPQAACSFSLSAIAFHHEANHGRPL